MLWFRKYVFWMPLQSSVCKPISEQDFQSFLQLFGILVSTTDMKTTTSYLVPANCKPGTILVTALSEILCMVMVAVVCNQTSSIFRHALLKDSEQL